MNEIKYTLLSDGRSDKALMNIIDWLFSQLLPQVPVQKQFADFSFIPKPPPNDRLDLRILKAIELYPCDIVFVHRDAESSRQDDYQNRSAQIQESYDRTNQLGAISKLVKMIPVRMMEAWLLIDEYAIKMASGNRNNAMDLNLPPVNRLETISDPKKMLDDLIKGASGLHSRRLDKLNVREAVHRVAENIDDFSRLRQLSAFNKFEEDLKRVLQEFEFDL
jgi:hypothetical protein